MPHAPRKKANAQHSSGSWDWGTPEPITNLIHKVYAPTGGLELDVCSSDYWNHWTMKAQRFYDERADARVQLVKAKARSSSCNPPGPRNEVGPDGKVKRAPAEEQALVRVLWELLCKAWVEGRIDSVFWVGFSLEQLVKLQSSPMHPLQFPTIVPCARQRFLRRGPNGGPPVEGESPTHGNFLTLLTSRNSRSLAKEQLEIFRAGAGDLDGAPWGAIVRPL